MHIILCHENADFDALASLLAASKLNPEATPVLPAQQNRNVAAFLALYGGALPLAHRSDVEMNTVDQITLVDTQRLPQLKGLPQDVPVLVIDHHPVTEPPGERFTLTGEVIGAATTLLVEELQDQSISLEPLEATLLALGIYEDTGALTYGGTTSRDIRAAAWLLDQQAALDTVRRFLEPPLNEEQQALFEQLLKHPEMRVIQGYSVIVAGASTVEYVDEVAGVAHRLRDTLDPVALFVAVQMPNALQLVFRSTDDAIDVGKVARVFGGGGHERAAAASLHDEPLEQIISRLWAEIERVVQPRAHVRDLMSYGVQTVDADQAVGDIVRRLRRIGHEGFPVVDQGQAVGLLTRRDADRAVEHGLGKTAVREVMTAGNITLKADDSVGTLEATMMRSGWGQIPVVDDQNRLIGIVTRTDLLKHWAADHPHAADDAPETVSAEQIEKVLGKPVARLIDAIAEHAQQANVTLYMVGGPVRDLLLKRRNLDIDFVVEGDAIELAQRLKARYGGEVSSFRPFGTAKWLPDEAVAKALHLDRKALPENIDFASARNEFYEHPTALPTVYRSSIKLDLGRRDFTINTLAVQFSPEAMRGRLLDFYSGLRDLRDGDIRVLHNLSFIDDPTRILRAVRFSARLNFAIERRTAELMETAKPMLRRITGERVRNELNLLLREKEPERGLFMMQERGILEGIHPTFVVDIPVADQFARARTDPPPWPMPDLEAERVEVYWHLIGAGIPVGVLPGLFERLLFPQILADSVLAAAKVVQETDGLTHPDTRPSQIDARLHGVPDLALYVAWLVCNNLLVRERIVRYVTEWRTVRPATDGHTLKALGLKPGPCYGQVLGRLRTARLDGEVTTDEEEKALLKTVVETLREQGVCDDRS